MNGKNRTSVFLGFTALAITLSLSGCIVDATPTDTSSCADLRYVSVSWDIVKNVNNAPLSCDQAAASSVVLDLGPYTYQWPCSLYGGSTSTGVPEGDYASDLQLLGPNNEILSTSPTVTTSVFHCSSTTFPPVVFGVN